MWTRAIRGRALAVAALFFAGGGFAPGFTLAATPAQMPAAGAGRSGAPDRVTPDKAKPDKDKTALVSRTGPKLSISLDVDAATGAMRASRAYALQSAQGYIREAEEAAKALAAEDTELSAAYEGSFQAYWASDTFLSLHGTHYLFTGGAHGNTAFQSALFDLKANRPVPLHAIIEGLNRQSPVRARLVAYIRQEIARQKLEKDEETITPEAVRKRLKEDMFMGSEAGGKHAYFANYVFLTADTIGGKTNTLPSRAPVVAVQLLYAPYEMGAYAEGMFDVTVPVEVFREAVHPAFRAFFK